MHHHEKTDWTEKLLIENRTGKKFESDEDIICAFHRFNFGIGWRPEKRCYHPEHEQAFGKPSPELRPVSIYLSLEVSKRYEVNIPIGSVFCNMHRKGETTFYTPKDKDQKFQPDEIEINDEVAEESQASGSSICKALEISPFRWQIKKKKVADLSEGTKEQLRRKFERAKDQLALKFAEAVAPTQVSEFIDEVLNPHPDLQILLSKYRESDSIGKIVVLSLVNHAKYTKEFLINFFGCSKYSINQARRINSSDPGLLLPKPSKNIRCKLDHNKVEHFLDYLFSNGLLQDVAYGVTKIKFDSGEMQKNAQTILTAKYNHTISFYNQMCKDISYQPLSDRSLWRILHAIKPSQRKSLAGLDDMTAAGMNGFTFLQQIAAKFKSNDIRGRLEGGKRYLKMRYQINCSTTDSTVFSHCPEFALSDSTDKLLKQPNKTNNEAICQECIELFCAMKEVRNIAINNSASQDLLYDIDIATKDIFDYMKHLMRDAQQKKAKKFAFEKLDNETAFWLKDYCQKIIPTKFREGQKEYFGKKGMSLHVDVFFIYVNNELRKKVYFTALYRCDQGIADTLSLADIVLDKFKTDFTNVKKMYAKSDNASSYHGNFVLEELHNICKQKNIRLMRYDYNEPCRGKDQCDREAARYKSLMRSYVDAGNNILNAEDIFKSFHYSSGMKNVAVAVAQVDSHTPMIGEKIPKISNYHSFEFHDDYMIMWRYFGIGSGVIWHYNNVRTEKRMRLVIPFSNTNSQTEQNSDKTIKKVREDRQFCTLHYCFENDCNAFFDRAEDLEYHMISGTHNVSQILSGFDKVKQSFINRVKKSSNLHSLSLPSCSNVSSVINIEGKIDVNPFNSIGWALPVRSNFRFSSKQKKILFKYFIDGEESGKKFSPEQVHLLLRKDLPIDEYVTSQQIRSLFSRWSKQRRQNTLKNPNDEVISDEENELCINEDDEDYIEGKLS